MLKPFLVNSETEVFHVPNRVTVLEANLTTPLGKEVKWYCAKMRHVAVVLAINEKGEVCLKREWRLARRDFVWELPSGFLNFEDPNDPDVSDAANRELQEEVGVRAGKLEKLLTFYPHNHMRMQVNIFLGTELEPGETSLEEHEFLEVEWVPFDVAYQRVMENQAPNAQTALALLLARQKLKI